MATETVTRDDQDAYDKLSNKLAHLQSMLMMTYGGAHETFTAMNDTLQDNYLWACCALVEDCIELSDQVGFLAYPGSKANLPA